MIYTSYFAFIPKLPSDMLKISVSLYTPQWAKADGCFSCLNPTEQLLREAKSGTISPAKAMKKISQRDSRKIIRRPSLREELIEMLNRSNKQRLALLCYEKPGEICHRRFIAQ